MFNKIIADNAVTRYNNNYQKLLDYLDAMNKSNIKNNHCIVIAKQIFTNQEAISKAICEEQDFSKYMKILDDANEKLEEFLSKCNKQVFDYEKD